VVIAGGGAIGSAIAHFLSSAMDFRGSILVVEPDPSYRSAASSRSASSIRQQFSSPINIELSAFGMQFLREAPQRLGCPDLQLGLIESSYLYLATAQGA
jgi:FAD-dependent oxidoreductase domain-containing protein 1